jgi:hypothetical protein
MSVTAIRPPVTDTEVRAGKLTWLAGVVISGEVATWPRGVVTDDLRLWADPSLTGEALGQQFERYADAEKLRLDVEEETVTWQDIEPDLTCGDRAEAARKITAANAAAELDVLLRGTR